MFWCRPAFLKSLQLSLVQISFIYNALAVVPMCPCFSVTFSFVSSPEHWIRMFGWEASISWILSGGTLPGLSLGVSALQPVSWWLCGVLWGLICTKGSCTPFSFLMQGWWVSLGSGWVWVAGTGVHPGPLGCVDPPVHLHMWFITEYALSDKQQCPLHHFKRA